MKKLLAFIPILMCLSGFAQSSEDVRSDYEDITVEDSAPESESDFPSLSEWSEERKESAYKYPKMEGDLKYYLPSVLGMVSGNNPFIQLRENYEAVEDCTNIFVESRGDILSVGKDLSFAWSLGFGSYFDSKTTDGNKYTTINLSAGAGMYYHPFNTAKDTFVSMRGLCVFLYPIYQIPVYNTCPDSFVKWKSAFDIGYNLVLIDAITVYPYMRTIGAWTKTGFQPYLDFGIAIGVYFPDYKYREAHR